MRLYVCVFVRVCASLAFESGFSSGHTDLIVQSLLVDLYPFQHIPLSERLRNRLLTPSSLLSCSLFLSLPHFLLLHLWMGLIYWLCFSIQNLKLESVDSETYRFSASGAHHYLAIAHQRIHQQAGARIDASCQHSGSNIPFFISSPYYFLLRGRMNCTKWWWQKCLRMFWFSRGKSGWITADMGTYTRVFRSVFIITQMYWTIIWQEEPCSKVLAPTEFCSQHH